MKLLVLVLCGLVICFSADVRAQTTEFAYQGSLKDGTVPANGNYDFEFALFDAMSGGTQIGGTVQKNAVAVANGAFAVKLDFGSVFPGANRYLEIRVKPAGAGAFTILGPRQLVNSTPYSITAADATSPNIARLNVPNTAVTATAVPVVNSGFITSANVTNGGAGYATAPAVTVKDPTGSGAVLIATISGGSVTSLTVQNPGSGYSASPTLTLDAPPSNANQTFVTPNFFTGVNTMNNPKNTFAGTFTGNGAALSGVVAVDSAQLAGLPPDRFVQTDINGDVAIGTAATGSKLAVGGVIESTAGGVKFPDGSTQTSAAGGDNPALQPFIFETNVSGSVSPAVPAGKRLVIEWISGALRTTGTNSWGPIQLIQSGAVTGQYIPPTITRTDISDTVSYFSQSVRMYLSAGQTLTVYFPTNTQFRAAALHGYYVNLPVSAQQTAPLGNRR